jgi:hypothetical protein
MLGKPVPDFSLPSTGGSIFRLADQRGRKLLVPCFSPEHNHRRRKVRGCARLRARRGVKVPCHAEEVVNFAKAL